MREYYLANINITESARENLTLMKHLGKVKMNILFECGNQKEENE